MAVSSPQIQDLEYLYASNANVSNFVSVKLSGNNNYHLWKTQMLCLMETHDMCRIVDSEVDGPRASSLKMKKQYDSQRYDSQRYDSLLRGWIFGSISENVLGTVVDLSSAKDVWNALKSFYEPTISIPQDSTHTELEAIEETKAKDVSWEIEIEDSAQTKPEAKEKTKDNFVSRETETEDKEKELRNSRLRKANFQHKWPEVEAILEEDKDALTAKLNSDGSTILHLAAGISGGFMDLLSFRIKDKTLLEVKRLDGSTPLHVAAFVGNTYAAQILVNKNKKLLTIKDKLGEEPLLKACSSMKYDCFFYLLEAAKSLKYYDYGPHKEKDDDLGVKFLVNAISAKEYIVAKMLVKRYPTCATKKDEALMAIAKTFPSGLNYWERFIYPSLDLDDIRGRITKRSTHLINVFKRVPSSYDYGKTMLNTMVVVPVMMFCLAYILISYLTFLLTLMLYFPFSVLYFFSWEVAKRLAVPPVKHIVEENKELEEARKFLKLVCDTIGTNPRGVHNTYKKPILEAARQNVFEVVDEILTKSPEAIQYKDKSGYDIIQLAVIHRSENIYNLIYRIKERKDQCRTFKDTSKNNILHLAGRLAPSEKLNCRTGAALQLQRELQWFEELKTIVFPSYITEENIYKETPAMVFTREHMHLVKEGEKWMKITAESCSITAGLIITIVFAAAITVPGGNDDKTGTPLFTKDIAFIIFAISDAISLFTATTSLLVFLSILTARFAEQDFLVRLPRRLIIGLCTLFLSTTAMIVAFSATLFLVFCDKKPWMLAPICGLACIPIVSFVTLQFPLIVDLFRSTYVPIFGNSCQGRFELDEVQGYFGNSYHGMLSTMLLGKGKAVTEVVSEPQGTYKPPPMVEENVA